jgi:hypothetical protein
MPKHKNRPDDGGKRHLWNVGKLLPDYTTQQPRRQYLHSRLRENLKFHIVFIAYDTRRRFMPHFVRILGTVMKSSLSFQYVTKSLHTSEQHANWVRQQLASSSRTPSTWCRHMLVGCSIVQSYSVRTAKNDEYLLASVTPIFWHNYLLLSSIFIFQFLLYLCLNYTRSCSLDRSFYFSFCN